MEQTILKLKKFCEDSNFEIFSMIEDEIVIRNDGDTWKVIALPDGKCKFYHLNNRGKLQWHTQGKSKFHNLNYIRTCIKYHNTYKSNII